MDLLWVLIKVHKASKYYLKIHIKSDQYKQTNQHWDSILKCSAGAKFEYFAKNLIPNLHKRAVLSLSIEIEKSWEYLLNVKTTYNQ